MEHYYCITKADKSKEEVEIFLHKAAPMQAIPVSATDDRQKDKRKRHISYACGRYAFCTFGAYCAATSLRKHLRSYIRLSAFSNIWE